MWLDAQISQTVCEMESRVHCLQSEVDESCLSHPPLALVHSILEPQENIYIQSSSPRHEDSDRTPTSHVPWGGGHGHGGGLSMAARGREQPIRAGLVPILGWGTRHMRVEVAGVVCVWSGCIAPLKKKDILLCYTRMQLP